MPHLHIGQVRLPDIGGAKTKLDQPDQGLRLVPVSLFFIIAKRPRQRLFQHIDVPVLAVDQRHHDPMVRGPHLPVAPVIAHEGLVRKTIVLHAFPPKKIIPHHGRRRGMGRVRPRDQRARRQSRIDLPHQQPIHKDPIPRGHRPRCKFVLGGYVLR